MKRQHGDSGQILFADLAMAVLGPMAALMIIFLLLAAKNVRPCISLDKQQTEIRVQQLQQWADKMNKTIRLNKNIPTIACEDFSRSTVDEIESTPIIPPSLYGLCTRTITEIFEQAGLSENKVNDIVEYYQDSMLAAASHITNCVKAKEILYPTEKKIAFGSCQTIPLHPQTRKKMSRDDFSKDMAEIVTKLNQFPDYNRVDIFGHADARQISKPCPNGAKNNRELSSLRVHAYLDGLETALRNNKNNQNFAPIYKRWTQGNLKIYAIGVGEKEPLDTRKSREAYRKNRRIEIRFGIDKRAK